MTAILVIEDIPDSLSMIVDVLQLAGFTVYSAIYGRQGLEFASKHTPDIILCNSMLPDMQGLQVLKQIKNSAPLEATQFILMLAAGELLQNDTRREVVPDGCLLKPFTFHGLTKAIDDVMKKM